MRSYRNRALMNLQLSRENLERFSWSNPVLMTPERRGTNCSVDFVRRGRVQKNYMLPSGIWMEQSEKEN
jgi:hypothetical protein